jgi:hypothetical protein
MFQDMSLHTKQLLEDHDLNNLYLL